MIIENGGRTQRLDFGLAQRPQKPVDPKSFAESAKAALRQVDHLQKTGDKKVGGLATGDVTDVHDVTIALEEAQLSMSLLIEVRNRVLEAYQEVMRMQM